MRYLPSVSSRWLDIGQVLFLPFLWTETKSRFTKTQKKDQGQYPAFSTEQAWSIKDLIYGFIFKLKLQQQNQTEHETVLLEKKFFIAGRFKIYFQCIFSL